MCPEVKSASCLPDVGAKSVKSWPRIFFHILYWGRRNGAVHGPRVCGVLFLDVVENKMEKLLALFLEAFPVGLCR
jgi:hypothetical protein